LPTSFPSTPDVPHDPLEQNAGAGPLRDAMYHANATTLLPRLA
jgi:hypothetical protein